MALEVLQQSSARKGDGGSVRGGETEADPARRRGRAGRSGGCMMGLVSKREARGGNGGGRDRYALTRQTNGAQRSIWAAEEREM